MSTYYAITPVTLPYPVGDQRSVIRAGTLPEMRLYIEASPGMWRLWRITRRGHWHEMPLTSSASGP